MKSIILGLSGLIIAFVVVYCPKIGTFRYLDSKEPIKYFGYTFGVGALLVLLVNLSIEYFL